MGKSHQGPQKANNRKDGRLVWNHSTHLPGLIPILENLCQQDGIHTITPGVIGRVRGHSPKMQLRISVPIRGGYKVIARQGKTVQEVFILTSLVQDELQTAIAIAMNQSA
ncbi:DUF2103 domain-containing protein [Nostoc sp. CHAB 5844]|nr:DUF2103 domain-containing protein [Nostoc sp. CHAB 5844]